MILLLFLWYVSLCNCIISSREEDIELEQEFQRLTKPSVKTLQTINGDIYNCVDFYQQLAFDDPLMKNHSFRPQMKSNPFPRGKRYKNCTFNLRPENIWINGEGCPNGTVPIRQITKDDIISAKQAAEIYASNLNPQTAERPGVHFAVLHTPRLGTEVKYYGAGMNNELCNPKLNHVSQYSSSQVKLQNGHESIIFGWTVHPKVYKDTKTRMFIYTYANNKHCFNDFCGLFIHTNPDIPLGDVFDHLSPMCGMKLHSVNFLVQKDKPNGDWALKFLDGTVVGIWPSRFFTGLGKFATYIEWGGEVYSPSHIPSPQMGKGVPADYHDYKCRTQCDKLRLVNEDGKWVPAMSLDKYEDINKYYRVINLGYFGPELERAMNYGGQGGYIGT
ncbi:hypothetical protein M5689_008054 [Euphorbia peplus]|nr:hypothetical protein M5689_008054 [Euphorbia peplus]